jgi:hypothetical protein
MMRDGRAKTGTGASSPVRSAVPDKISRHPARTWVRTGYGRWAGLCGKRASAVMVFTGGRSPTVQAAYFENLDAERLQPGEQSVQGRLILQRTMHDRFDGLNRGGEPFEVEQGLGRKNTSHPDLVIGRWHHSP